MSECYCYECQQNQKERRMQKYECVICHGRKCHLHGGEFLHKCKTCQTTHLCIDCVSFAKCCEEYNSETRVFTFVGTKIFSRTLSKY